MNCPCYSNAYIIHRRYGGPEEGGWWYSEGFPLATIDATNLEDEVAQLICTIIDESYKNQYTQDTDTTTDVLIQKHRARHFPTYKPIYQ